MKELILMRNHTNVEYVKENLAKNTICYVTKELILVKNRMNVLFVIEHLVTNQVS